MDLDEMKKRFNALDTRLESLEADHRLLISQVMDGKIKSAQTKLCQKYRRFSIIGLCMSIVIILFYRGIFPMAHCVGLSVFFLIASGMDFYLWQGVKGIDYSTMGVEQVARKALFYRKRHHIFMAILMAICVPLIGSLFWVFRGNDSYVLGMAAGGVVGLAIGIRTYIHMMREYRNIYSLDSSDN